MDHGERVTLASLHTLRLLNRRAWRGTEGGPDDAYEYQATGEVMDAVRETLDDWFTEYPTKQDPTEKT